MVDLGCFGLLAPSLLELQQTVPFWQVLFFNSVEGLVQNDSIICGMHTPGHLSFVFGAGLGVVLAGLGFSTFLVRQHLPLPGQCAFRSMASHNSAKNPVTHVPIHCSVPPLPVSLLGGPECLFVRCVVVVVVVGLNQKKNIMSIHHFWRKSYIRNKGLLIIQIGQSTLLL